MKYVALSLVALAPALTGCYGLYGNDEFERYVQRYDGVTLSAGDAKEVNARTHMNDPWPYRVNDRRIFVEGARAVPAVERYRGDSSHAAAPTPTVTISGGGSSTGTAATKTPQ